MCPKGGQRRAVTGCASRLSLLQGTRNPLRAVAPANGAPLCRRSASADDQRVGHFHMFVPLLDNGPLSRFVFGHSCFSSNSAITQIILGRNLSGVTLLPGLCKDCLFGTGNVYALHGLSPPGALSFHGMSNFPRIFVHMVFRSSKWACDPFLSGQAVWKLCCLRQKCAQHAPDANPNQ